jgi:hypothetical protein
MSEDNNNPSNSHTGVEQGAFIEDVHKRTKRNHLTTVVISVLLPAAMLTYLWVLTYHLKRDFTEENIQAYLVASLDQKIQENAPEYIKQAKDYIPKAIQEEVPTYLVSKIPEIREGVQTQAEDYFNRSLDDVKSQVEEAVGEFVIEYKDEITKYVELIETAKKANTEDERKRLEDQAKTTINQLSKILVDGLLEIAEKREFDNPSVDATYKSSLSKLTRINADLLSLVSAPDEKLEQKSLDLRYAIALMLDKLDWSTPNHVRKPTEKVDDPAPEKK